MSKYLLAALIFSTSVFGQVGKIFEDLNPSNPKHRYIGARKCLMCHNSAQIGGQGVIWHASAHAHALATLSTKEAKEVGHKVGIEDPSKSPYCIQCHVTAYGTNQKFKARGYSIQESITCESCHGPGEHYANMAAMKNPELGAAMGLIRPTPKSCTVCHDRERQPQTGAKKYDFKKMFHKIKHYRPGSVPSKDWK